MKTLFFAILLMTAPALAVIGVPNLDHPVNDFSNVLTRSGKEKIAQAIVDLKTNTGAQAGVVLIDTIGEHAIEEVSMDFARQWKLGSKDRDDGILMFIVVKDHKMRLEVGYGLEGIITDIQSHHINESMKPALRAGNYDQAILAGISTISQTITAHKNEITSKGIPKEDNGIGFFSILLGFLGLGGIVAFFVHRSFNKERKRLEAERIANADLTAEQRLLALQMQADMRKEMKRNPYHSSSDDFTTGVIVGSAMSRSEESSSSYSSSDDSSSFSSSSSDSSWSGGGGDFGGGGSSDSW